VYFKRLWKQTGREKWVKEGLQGSGSSRRNVLRNPPAE
jgi:hypothetical protein